LQGIKKLNNFELRWAIRLDVYGDRVKVLQYRSRYETPLYDPSTEHIIGKELKWNEWCDIPVVNLLGEKI